MSKSLWLAVPLAALLAHGALAQQPIEALPEQARLETTEEWTTATLPEASPHWIWILDVAFDTLIASRVNIYDADNGRFLGVVHTGYVPNFLIAPDRSELYVTETYWSRGTQGERIDVVSIYDARSLERLGEVVLPRGRGLVIPKKPMADLTPDGRFLLSFNLSPATSVSLVDLRERRYVGEIEVPGCSLVYPTGLRSFAMLCPDGSLLDVQFAEDGRAEIAANEPFFDAENDPVFEHAALDAARKQGFFLSYEGMLYEVAFDNGRSRVTDRWSIVSEADKAEDWRPGGWQLTAWHEGLGQLYVLMHRGPRWSHKVPGEEVWVIDPKANVVVKRLPLDEAAISLLVTPDSDPLLVTLTDTGVLGVYDPETGQLLRVIEGVGSTPFLLHAAGP